MMDDSKNSSKSSFIFSAQESGSGTKDTTWDVKESPVKRGKRGG